MKNYILIVFLLCSIITYAQDVSSLKQKWEQIDKFNDNGHYLKSYKILSAIDEEKLTPKSKVKYFTAMVLSHLSLKNNDSCNFYLDKFRKLTNSNNDLKKYESRICNLEAQLLLRNFQMEKALDKLFDCKSLAEKIGNKSVLAKNLFLIGRVMYFNGDRYNVERYLKQAIELAQEIKDYITVFDANGLLATYYIDKNLFDEAEKQIKKAEEVSKGKLNQYLIYTLYGRLYTQKGQPELSNAYVLKAIKLNEELNVVTINSDSTIIDEKKSKFIKNSTAKLKDSTLFKIAKAKEAYLKTHLAIEEHDKNYKRQIYFLKERLKLKDSLYNIDKQKIITELEKKYKTQEKEKENLQLQNEAKERELVLAKENRQKWIFGIISLGIAMTLGIFIFFYRRNRKQKRFIEYLQREMHHRVKNNLSIINAFIDNANDEDNKAMIEEKLQDLQNRIDSIYEIHEQLYISKDVANFNVKQYINTLSKNIQKSFYMEAIEIKNNIDSQLEIDADKSFSIGLIVNEFLTNSFKYAFKENNGLITIDFKKDKDNYYLSLSDNGKGLPEDIDIQKLKSYGLRIITLLVEQLEGSYLLENNNGVSLKIKFPKV